MTNQALEDPEDRKANKEWTDFEAAEAYREEFLRLGLDLVRLGTEEASRRIQDSRIKYELVAALDDWWRVTQSTVAHGTGEAVARTRLLHVAQLADPDRSRNQLRGAVERDDDIALTSLSHELEIQSQPASTVLQLAQALLAQSAQRRD